MTSPNTPTSASGRSADADAKTMALIEARSIPEPNSGCWLWTSTLANTGYGRVVRGRKQLGAHRLAWEAANCSAVPAGMFICHRCDVTMCVNPDHLFLGTPQDNVADMDRKGRAVRRGAGGSQARGTRQHLARLDDEAVRYLRMSSESCSVLAARFGVSVVAIKTARRGGTWTHVQPREWLPQARAERRAQHLATLREVAARKRAERLADPGAMVVTP